MEFEPGAIKSGTFLQHFEQRFHWIFFSDKITAAQRFYHQALLVDFSQGLPYNQLATLAGSDRFGLNAVFYYLRW